MELLWIELKRQLPNTATVVPLHIQVRNWMHSASLFFYFLCGPLTDSLFSPNLSSLYFPAGNSVHPPCIPPSFPTSPRQLCMRRQANVGYFTQQNLYVGDLAKLIFHTNSFPLLTQPTTSIWQPFIFHAPSFSPEDKQQEAGERWDCEGYDLTCMTVSLRAWARSCEECVLEGWGWVGCQQDSQGKGKNLVVYVTPPASCGIVLIQRSLPCPPLGAHKQLTTTHTAAGACSEIDMLKCFS